MPSRIEDYAIIGDCHTVALVARDGSIDWLCLPRLDSGACFAALLGTPDNGRWLLAPAGEVRAVSRRYRDGTLILETDYRTDEGEVTEGEVKMRVNNALDGDEVDEGWVLTCQSEPVTPNVTVVYDD